MPSRVFAPSDDRSYVFASSPGEPALVVDRHTASVRIVPGSELDTLIGPPGGRAKSIQVIGLVGLVKFADDSTLAVVTEVGSRSVATEYGCRTVDYITKAVLLPMKPPTDQWQPPDSGGPSGPTEASVAALGKQRAHLKDFLEAGDFFLAGADACALTHTLQRRAERAVPDSTATSLTNADPRFVWNAEALEPFVMAGADAWTTPIMQGAIFTERITIPGGGVLTASLISRRSCEHAGTRFKTRGLNDDGAAANFVEVEQVLHMQARSSAVTSYVQVRGSVPVFWEQRGKMVNPKPRVSRVVELTTPALRTHIESLASQYGPPLLLSLLDLKGDEESLSDALKRCLAALRGGPACVTVPLVSFDFHAATKATGRADACRNLMQRLQSEKDDEGRAILPSQGYFAAREGDAKPAGTQQGIVRTNCLDCLNRTNMAQAVIALQSATFQLRALGSACKLSDDPRSMAALESQLGTSLRKMWTETGDAISLQYTGTGNLSKGSNITGEAVKKSLIERASGLVEKGVRTVNRYVQEQFLEDTRQVAIDVLLGGSSGGSVRNRRSSSVAQQDLDSVSLLIGTWNVNGKICSFDDLMSWLRAPSDAIGAHTPKEPPGACIVGFQEFVDLNAQNLLRDDASRRLECKTNVERALAEMYGEAYIQVGVEQMVGVLLLVYVRPKLAESNSVRRVCSDVVKTGFGSDSLGVKAGNKGGVAVRLELFGMGLCIINSHLPAGSKHADERNETYAEVLRGLASGFSSARGGPYPPPLDHDLCVWLGDLNYRIERPRDEVERRIADGDLGTLLTFDQLKNAQRTGAAFPDFEEAAIQFQPTYKYDGGTSQYDSSEKQRVPSWTDRILWKAVDGSVDSLAYVATQSVMRSDHKPVSAWLVWTPAELRVSPAVAAPAVSASFASPPTVSDLEAPLNSCLLIDDVGPDATSIDAASLFPSSSSEFVATKPSSPSAHRGTMPLDAASAASAMPSTDQLTSLFPADPLFDSKAQAHTSEVSAATHSTQLFPADDLFGSSAFSMPASVDHVSSSMAPTLAANQPTAAPMMPDAEACNFAASPCPGAVIAQEGWLTSGAAMMQSLSGCARGGCGIAGTTDLGLSMGIANLATCDVPSASGMHAGMSESCSSVAWSSMCMSCGSSIQPSSALPTPVQQPRPMIPPLMVSMPPTSQLPASPMAAMAIPGADGLQATPATMLGAKSTASQSQPRVAAGAFDNLGINDLLAKSSSKPL